MDRAISLPRELLDRLEKVSKLTRAKPETIARDAIATRVTYLEWEAKALREGQKDLEQGRTMSTADLRAALSTQRNARAKKPAKAA